MANLKSIEWALLDGTTVVGVHQQRAPIKHKRFWVNIIAAPTDANDFYLIWPMPPNWRLLDLNVWVRTGFAATGVYDVGLHPFSDLAEFVVDTANPTDANCFISAGDGDAVAITRLGAGNASGIDAQTFESAIVMDLTTVTTPQVCDIEVWGEMVQVDKI